MSDNGVDSLLVHRCRFVQSQPASIGALALNDAENLLAIGRDNGSLELWNLENNFYQERIIAGHGAIRRLNFVNSGASISQTILATSGLDGYLRLYDINTQSNILDYYIGCGPIWDQCRIGGLGKKNVRLEHFEALVVSGDDGSVRIIFVPHDTSDLTSQNMALLEHITLRGASKRVVSVAAELSQNGETIWVWAGSQDGHLYRWDVTLNSEESEYGMVAKSTSPASVIDLTRGAIPWAIQIAKTEAVPGQVLTTGSHSVLVGDSDGHLSIWDGAMGVLLQTLQHHKADVLRLVLTPSNASIFTVGVDNTISLYQKSSNTTVIGGENINNNHNTGSGHVAPWVFVASRRSHTHDILAAVGGTDRLFTGGIDTKLLVHEYYDLLKLPGRAFLPFAQSGPSVIASLTPGSTGLKDRMVVQLENRLQVWRLGKALKNGSVDPKNNHHDILEEQALLLDIAPKVSGRIMCHASSPRAHRIAFSDNTSTKVFCIRERGAAVPATINGMTDSNNSTSTVTNNNITDFVTFSDPVLTVEKKIFIKGTSSKLLFTHDGQVLIRATPNSHLIQMWDVSDPDRPTLLHTFHEHASKTKSTSSRLGISESHPGMSESLKNIDINGGNESSAKPINILVNSPKLLASSDLNNRVFVYSLESRQMLFALPAFEERVTAMVFDPKEKHLAIALASNKFFVYNLQTRALSDWSRQHSTSLPAKLTSSQEKIVGMVFHPTVPGMVFVYGHTFIFYAQTAGSGSRMWKMIKAYQPLFVDFADANSMVVVERPWLKVLQLLPPPFYRQRYAT